MPRYSSRLRYFFIFLLILIPFLLYALTLSIKIPYSFSIFFRQYSITLFVLVLALFAASFYLKGWGGALIGISVTLLLFALSLSYLWASGYSSHNVIGGLIPYKDSYYYYNGARSIVSGHLIPNSNTASSWRPLFPGFLAVLLLLTNHNLQISLALLSVIIGLACYLSARQVLTTSGIFPAAVYAALLFLYAPIGRPITEGLGLAFGCVALFLLWHAAQSLKVSYLITGLVTLVTAISIRAGPFLVLPLLVVWTGHAFRKEKRFSFKVAGIALCAEGLTFLLVNPLFQRLVAEAGKTVLGNFAYVLYGQVMGGTGWYRTVQDFGPSADTSLIFRTALQILIHHPLSFVLASAKSFRDFILPGVYGIFDFYPSDGMHWWNSVLWIAGLLLIIWGIIYTVRRLKSPLSSLVLAVFIGIMLSVPFLPPIDGGNRFYAGTIPFLFALMAFGLGEILPKQWKIVHGDPPWLSTVVLVASALLVTIILVMPPVIQRLTHEPAFIAPPCPADQVAFAVQVNPGSYIDLIPAGSPCGLAPELCLSDFEANGVEKTVDDFYQTIVKEARNAGTSLRLTPADNMIDGDFHFFLGNSALLQGHSPNRVVTGCATEIQTQFQSIYRVNSIILPTAIP